MISRQINPVSLHVRDSCKSFHLIIVRAPVESGEIVVQVPEKADRNPDNLSRFQNFRQLDNQELPRIVVSVADDFDGSVAVIDIDHDNGVLVNGHVLDVKGDVVRVRPIDVDGDVNMALSRDVNRVNFSH